jgi:hypothetical protein
MAGVVSTYESDGRAMSALVAGPFLFGDTAAQLPDVPFQLLALDVGEGEADIS